MKNNQQLIFDINSRVVYEKYGSCGSYIISSIFLDHVLNKKKVCALTRAVSDLNIKFVKFDIIDKYFENMKSEFKKNCRVV
jgi:hypothetical protein